MNIYYLSAFLIYFVILLMIGLFARKRHMTSEDFIMGNRSLSFWLVALTAHASDMSAWLFMGLPMVVFLLGISQASIAAGLIIGMYVNWQFVAPRLRTMTENYNCYTLPSFFENRFQDNSGIIRSVSAIILVTFMTHYLSAGMIGMGILLESLFGFNYYLGLIFALCIVVTYTFVGGFVAVAWTDLFQGIFLLLMIILVPLMAVMNLGGIQQIVEVLSQKNNGEIPVSIDDSMGVLTMLLLAVSWGAGYFGMPHITTKFMSIKNPSELNKSKWIGISWQVIALSGAVAVGVIARVFFAGGIEDPQMIFVDMVQAIFHPFIAG